MTKHEFFSIDEQAQMRREDEAAAAYAVATETVETRYPAIDQNGEEFAVLVADVMGAPTNG